MKVKDITDKLKGIVIPKDAKQEDSEINESEKKDITEEDIMTEEEKVVSNETDIPANENNNDNEEIKIRTIIVTEEDNGKESKGMLLTAGKIAVGVGIAAASLVAIFLSSKKRR